MTPQSYIARPSWLRLGLSLLGGGLLVFGILTVVNLGATEPAAARGLSQGPCITSTVSSDIITHTTWIDACSPYVVQTDTVAIRNGAVLTIEAGVVVSFQAGAQMQVVDNGRLYAVGTSANPITFTSAVTLSEQAPGDWIGIILNDTALANTIEYATIEYATTGINIVGQLDEVNAIRHSTFRFNGNGTTGSAMSGSPDGNDISYNEVYSCSTGFLFNEAFSNTIRSNILHAIDFHGIWFAEGLTSVGGDDNLLTHNIIYDCGGDGIRIEDGDDNNIVSNTIYNCQGNGIHLDRGYRNDVLTNIAYRNVEAGIQAVGQEQIPTFDGNRLDGNAYTPGSPALGALVIISSTTPIIRNNDLRNNGNNAGAYEAALYLNSNSTFFVNNIVVSGNIILGEEGDGIYYGPANSGIPLIQENVICVNCPGYGPYGLENQDGGIDAEGNWWGTNTPTYTQEITGPVDFSPWISLTIAPTHTNLPADSVFTVVFSVRMADGNGHTVPPPARTITLTASVGTVAPPTVTLNDHGIATATYTAGNVATTAVVTAAEFCGFEITATVELTATDVDLVVAKEDGVGPTDGNLTTLLSLIDEEELATRYGDVHAMEWRDSVCEGDLVTYTIAVANIGSYTATGVYVTETLPANTVFVGGTCQSPSICDSNTWELDSSGVYSIAVGTLASDEGAVVEFIVRITDTLPPSAIEVVNFACAGSEQADENPDSNCASQQTPVRYCRCMEVSKDANVPCAFPGDVVVYSITYANACTAPQSDVVLTECPSDHTTYASGSEPWTPDGSGCYTYMVGTVDPSATDSVNFAVQINDPLSDTVTAITNVVRISDGNEFVLTTPLPLEPDLEVVKNDNVSMASTAFVELYETITGKMYAQQVGVLQPGYVHPGDVISYSIAYANTGRATAHNVVITETLPFYTTYEGYGWIPAGGQYYTLTVGHLDTGDGGVVEFYVEVNDPLSTDVEWITNTVEIGGDEEECNTANNVSTEETPVTGRITPTHIVFLPLIMRGYPSEPEPPCDPIRVGAHPKSLVISEEHNRVYVTLYDDDGSGNAGGSGRLVALNLTTREAVAKVHTGGIHPMGVAILDDRLYVANHDSDDVSVMDANTLAVLETIPVGHFPFGVAATSERVYVTNFDDGTLSIIDPNTNSVINTVTVGRHPAFPDAWGDCAYVANHSGREGVTVVCDDGADVHRLREEWGYFATAVDHERNLVYFSRRDGLPGLYEISATPPYGPTKPVRKKEMLSTPPFAIAYNPETDHILVVAATNDQLHIIWPGSYHTGTVWPLRPQNEGPEWHGGQGLDVTGHDVWVANYADGSVCVLYDPP